MSSHQESLPHETSQADMPRFKLRQCSHFVIGVLWLGCLTYILLGLLMDKEAKSHRHIGNFRSPYIGPSHSGLILLDSLGFVPAPRLYPQSYHAGSDDLPVFVVAASSAEFDIVMDFVYSQRLYFPDKKLVVYNVDLNTDQVKQMRSMCRCVVRNIQWDHYPSHVKKIQFKAYKPILIQSTLMEFGAVFWCDAHTRFKTAEIFTTLNQAERVGVVGWPITYPTSTLTHYGLFRYFNASHKDYYFHRMIEADGILFYNTEFIHRNVMLPWVKCALDLDCIAPKGSQPRGCNFTHKPKYIYAGCHRYDTSALNVILGVAFKFETPYIAVMDMFDVGLMHRELR